MRSPRRLSIGVVGCCAWRMGASEDTLGEQARARVARAAARVAGCDDDPEREAQRELYDAVAFAATEARLDLRELIDAYGQGVPEVTFSDAWDAVEDCMDEVAFLSWYRVAAACQDAARVAPDWRGRLRLAIAAHNLALVVYRARGLHYDRVEQMRLQLAAVLTETTAAGVDREDLLRRSACCRPSSARCCMSSRPRRGLGRCAPAGVATRLAGAGGRRRLRSRATVSCRYPSCGR